MNATEMTKTILILDHDHFVCDLLRHFLARHGYNVMVSRDANETTRAMLGCSVDLILVDPSTSDEPPLELIEKLFQDSSAPMILMTDNTDRHFILEATRLGVKEFYLKSTFSCEGLMAKINSLVPPPPMPASSSQAPARPATAEQMAADAESSDETLHTIT
jgi:two-component system response regulator HydG